MAIEFDDCELQMLIDIVSGFVMNKKNEVGSNTISGLLALYNNNLEERTKAQRILNKLQALKEDIGEMSDGSHTFNELYHHRMVLFSLFCNSHKDIAWKSWKHDDGTMYDDYFIVGVTTPEGDYSYHYHKSNWDYFDVKELPNAPKYDGHKPSDIMRLYSVDR